MGFISICLLGLLAVLVNAENSLSGFGTYTDERYMDLIPFGTHSHWLQPWRSWMYTQPASHLANGIGTVWNGPSSAVGTNSLIAEMLSRHTIKHIRTEIGWGSFSYSNESQMMPQNIATMNATLLACQKFGIRPLLLINGNSGGPCPYLQFQKTLAEDAPINSTQVTLTDVSDLKVNYSGIAGDVMCEYIFTSINGNVATLSQPLQTAYTKGQQVRVDTILYRPFAYPYSADFNETMAGFNRYILNLARYAAEILGTTGASDLGFDMEVWNELSFGSDFLDINYYYKPQIYPNFDIPDVPIINSIAEMLVANPALFAGVLFSDGFSNTIPWPASSQTPDRFRAINKHPYAGRNHYPENDQSPHSSANVFGTIDPFIPTYTEYFPEYYGTFIQTETVLRDSGPYDNKVGGTVHGAYARVDPATGIVVDCPVWITEVNLVPSEDDPNITEAASNWVRTKATLRYYTFYLHKGVERLYIFDAIDPLYTFGLVQDNFTAFAIKNPTAAYPSDDSSYTSPILAAMTHLVAQFQNGMDPSLSLANTCNLTVDYVNDTHNHYQWIGNGTSDVSRPPLYDRDVLAILPYQINSTRFAIVYYVMTRDIMKDLVSEEFQIGISGWRAKSSDQIRISVYDPISDSLSGNSAWTFTAQGQLQITVAAVDYPLLLFVDVASASKGQSHAISMAIV